MAMRYSYDGYDLKASVGVVISNGSETFLAWPDPKDSLESDFLDTNGIGKDLSDPKFKAREFTLKCALIANGRDDFFYKYDGFFTLVTGAGPHELYITELDKTFVVYFKKQVNVTKLSQIDAQRVGVKFDLVLGELDPFDNITEVYLVDDQDRFLTA